MTRRGRHHTKNWNLMSEVYESYKENYGFLYITYGAKNIFG